MLDIHSSFFPLRSGRSSIRESWADKVVWHQGIWKGSNALLLVTNLLGLLSFVSSLAGSLLVPDSLKDVMNGVTTVVCLVSFLVSIFFGSIVLCLMSMLKHDTKFYKLERKRARELLWCIILHLIMIINWKYKFKWVFHYIHSSLRAMKGGAKSSGWGINDYGHKR